MRTPRLRYASSLSRREITSKLISSVSNTRASGRKVTVVPCLRVRPTSSSGATALPETILPVLSGALANAIRKSRLPVATSTVSHSDSAFTTDAPTPCRPPE